MSQRYSAVIYSGKVYQLSASTLAIAKALHSKGEPLQNGLTYDKLRKKAKVSENSVYVHVSRLKKAGLVRVVKANSLMEGTAVIPIGRLDFPSTKYVG